MKIKSLLLAATLGLMALPFGAQAHQLHQDHHQYQHHHANHWPFQIIIDPLLYLTPLHHGRHYKQHNDRHYQKPRYGQRHGQRRQHRPHSRQH